LQRGPDAAPTAKDVFAPHQEQVLNLNMLPLDEDANLGDILGQQVEIPYLNMVDDVGQDPDFNPLGNAMDNVNNMDILPLGPVNMELPSFDYGLSMDSYVSLVQQEPVSPEIVLTIQVAPINFLHHEIQPNDLNLVAEHNTKEHLYQDGVEENIEGSLDPQL
jgi:hypothetical protein